MLLVRLEKMDSTRTRRIISIHDYPEHLNPFSERHPSIQDKRKIFVDRLRKNGTWSSKISKRVSRSVTWLEKSWLPTGETKSPNNESEDNHKRSKHNKDAPRSKSYPIIKELPKTEHDSFVKPEDCQQTCEPTQETINDDSTEIGMNECENKKLKIKQRKKRPAPLPPTVNSAAESINANDTNSSSSERIYFESSCSRFGKQIESRPEDISQNEPEIGKCDSSVLRSDMKIDTSVSSSVTVENHIVQCDPSTEGESTPGKTLPKESEVSDHLERVQLNSEEDTSVEKSLETPENERLETADTVINDNNESRPAVQAGRLDTPSEHSADVLDENANISHLKSENFEHDDALSKIHCNGKAVQV